MTDVNQIQLNWIQFCFVRWLRSNLKCERGRVKPDKLRQLRSPLKVNDDLNFLPIFVHSDRQFVRVIWEVLYWVIHLDLLHELGCVTILSSAFSDIEFNHEMFNQIRIQIASHIKIEDSEIVRIRCCHRDLSQIGLERCQWLPLGNDGRFSYRQVVVEILKLASLWF